MGDPKRARSDGATELARQRQHVQNAPGRDVEEPRGPGNAEVSSAGDRPHATPPAEGEPADAFRLFDRLAAATPDVLCVFDLRTRRITYANRSVRDVLGYAPGALEAVGDDLLERFVHPDDLDAVSGLLGRCAALPDDVVLEHEHRMRHADGEYRWLRSRVVVFSRTPDGLPGQVLCLSRDVTEQRSTDQHLHDVERRVQAQVETALRQRDEFLTVAAHELKTPIASLKGFAQLELRRLQRASPPDRERIRRALDTIKSQADRLTRLVNGLLDVERLASGRLVIEPGLLDLTTLVRSAATAFAASARHTVQLHLAESFVVRADAVRIEQVLTSLLDNAVKFSPGGGAVEVSLAPHDSHAVQLAVRDHGLGIRPERRAAIFERFAPAPGATAGPQADPDPATHGMGLSLHVSRQIVELHGGTIVVESPPGGGTRFVVTLPLADPSES